MGVINTLREKMGKFVVGAVAVSILAFVGADLLGPNSAILGGNTQEVGVIAGQKVSYPEFVQEFETLKRNYTITNNQNPTSEIQDQIREQAWNNLIVKYAYQDEYDAIGLKVTEEERIDLVQGVNIHPSIQQAFTDESGVFDKARIINFLQNFDQLDPSAQLNWQLFENNLGPERLQQKMVSLIQKSTYINKYEGLQAHIKAQAKATGKFLYVPYFSIADSAVTVTEGLLKEILDERKEEFKLRDNFSMDYVAFEVTASKEDSIYYAQELNSIIEDFKTASDDTSFIKLNSDADDLPRAYRPDELPSELSNELLVAQEGDVFGPMKNGNNLELYKMIAVVEDSAGEYVRASHILFNTDEGEEEARAEANGVLRRARAGEDFAELAKEFSDGPTGTNGGDLGWFTRGRMVSEFEEAAFNASSEGVIPSLVKTQFGFHIINITAAKSTTKYMVGKVVREITPSDDTRNEVFRQADLFSGTINDAEAFQAKAEELGLTVSSARELGKSDRTINAMSGIREIIRWGFGEANVGDVSEVFETENNFLVALLTEKNEEGYPAVEDVKERLTPIALKRVKGDEIISRLSQLSEQDDLNAIAETYGSNANVYDINNSVLNTNTLTGAGFDPAAIGYLFGMEVGAKSEPFRGENGIMILQLDELQPADEQETFDNYKTTLVSQRSNGAVLGLSEAIKEKAAIEDNRYRFY